MQHQHHEDMEVDQDDESDHLSTTAFIPNELSGIILRITLKNFMCHTYLEVDLNPNTNFLTGLNGSGKSAILTAIVLGLGARAATTCRGKSINSFIQYGSNSATIELRLKNTPPHSYKHELYGDFITIIRVIHSGGSSAYKIKSSSGDVISTKSDEVSTICSVFSIQVTNPICVLNQEEAKNFHSSNANIKYTIFRRSINIDDIEENCQKSKNNCNSISTILRRKEEMSSEREKSVKLKQKQLETQKNLHAKLVNAENEYYWSQIEEMEKEINTKQKQCSRFKMSLETLNKRVEESDNVEKKTTQKIENLQEQLQELKLKKSNHNAEYQKYNAKYQDLERNYKQYTNSLEKLTCEISQVEEKILYYENEIKKFNIVSISDKREMERKRIELERHVNELQSRKTTIENDYYQKSEQLLKLQGASQQMESEIRNTRVKIGDLESQLKELQNKKTGNLAVFSNQMVRLVDAIERNANRFSQKPRGPIGAYIKVNDKKWSRALEQIIGGNIQTFCVNSNEDARQLFSIMGSIYGGQWKPSVCTSQFSNRVHNVSNNKVAAPRGYASALDCLTISDPVVANFLIDHCRLESILLASSHEDAMQIAADVRNVPRGMLKIVVADRSEYFPAPNYRQYGGNGKQSYYLQESTDNRKAQLNEELNENRAKLQESIQKLSNYKNTVRSVSSEKMDLENLANKINGDIRKQQEKIQVINNEIHEMSSEAHGQFIDEFNAAKEELNNLNNQMQKMTEITAVAKKNMDECNDKLRPLRMNFNKDEENRYNNELLTAESKLERLKSEKVGLVNERNEVKNHITRINDENQKKRETLKGKIEEAENLCERISPTRPMNIVKDEIIQLKSQIEAMDKSGKSSIELHNDILEEAAKFQALNSIIKRLTMINLKTQDEIKRQSRYAAELLKYITSRVQTNFQLVLTIRQYTGRMLINHEKQTLLLECTGRDIKRLANTTGSLSGGERSYATVAFILALWECIELPFYILDEFDVFMDQINRNTIIDLLLDHTKRNTHRQYIFLTPLGVKLDADRNLKIHRMAAPIRNSITS